VFMPVSLMLVMMFVLMCRLTCILCHGD